MMFQQTVIKSPRNWLEDNRLLLFLAIKSQQQSQYYALHMSLQQFYFSSFLSFVSFNGKRNSVTGRTSHVIERVTVFDDFSR